MDFLRKIIDSEALAWLEQTVPQWVLSLKQYYIDFLRKIIDSEALAWLEQTVPQWVLILSATPIRETILYGFPEENPRV